MEAAAQLHQAILALYGPHPEAVQQANAWLNSFSKEAAAWEACLAMLDPQQVAEVCFFAANMLLTKARAEWLKLDEAQQRHIAAVIGCGRSAAVPRRQLLGGGRALLGAPIVQGRHSRTACMDLDATPPRLRRTALGAAAAPNSTPSWRSRKRGWPPAASGSCWQQ
jgi:hypothetical protein